MAEPFAHQRKALPAPAVFLFKFINVFSLNKEENSDQNLARNLPSQV